MSAPDKCPRCGASLKEGWENVYQCGTFATGSIIDQHPDCYIRQRDAAQAQIATLKAERVETNLATQRLAARVKELEEARTKAAANSLANMLHVEGLNRKIARLIAEGDALRKVVARDYPRSEFCDAWDKAKEKP